MESQWLSLAKRLQAIASTGAYYCRDEYDKQRYQEIGDIAQRMLADLGSVPLDRIKALVSDFARGYETPKVDVRGTVVEDDRVLLVRERSDGLWTLPGGFAEVGRSPARNVEKEVWEEAGIRVAAKRLYAVRYKGIGSYDPDAREFYKLFFLCERLDDATPGPGDETTGAGFFAIESLPPLSMGRVIRQDVERAMLYARDLALPTFFE
ncbi:NUDIX hydrolase [Bradyrhizobium sp. 162]|uniref:NUDIX hydrolase n=1 Tax=Bradyrhizobium sp. 162 TaxID=2782635 RepID=UPI001FF7BDFF|nr:NUDIX hydrolase [Bradyrhizobium sp. 162]MCK1635444.1 NUDIX hydrolase [Bradyrhizobium sp. 162]